MQYKVIAHPQAVCHISNATYLWQSMKRTTENTHTSATRTVDVIKQPVNVKTAQAEEQRRMNASVG